MFKASRVFQTSEFSGSYSCLGLLTSVERDRREIARCPRSITPTPKPLECYDAHVRCHPHPGISQDSGKNCYSRNMRVAQILRNRRTGGWRKLDGRNAAGATPQRPGTMRRTPSGGQESAE